MRFSVIILLYSVRIAETDTSDVVNLHFSQTQTHMTTFPKQITWYPGSGADFVAAIIPYIKFSNESPDSLPAQVFAPVVMNDFDPMFDNLWGSMRNDTEFYANGQFLVPSERKYVSVMLNMGVERILVKEVIRHETEASDEIRSVMPAWFEIRLEVDIRKELDGPVRSLSITTYFVSADAFRFFDTVVPGLGVHIEGLILLRMGCPGTYGLKDGVSKELMSLMEQHPEIYNEISFAWFDRTVDPGLEWTHVNDAIIEHNLEHGLVSELAEIPALAELARKAWIKSPYSQTYWGTRSSRYAARMYFRGKQFVDRARPEGMNTYWVVPGLLLAGEWPGGIDREEIRVQIQKYFDTGIRTFVNLVPDYEHGHLRESPAYDRYANALAREQKIEVNHVHFPFRDMTTPTDIATFRDLITDISVHIEHGEPSYIHCWAGLGRTGVVVGAWLREHSVVSGDQIVAYINVLRTLSGDDTRYTSPQTEKQVEFIENWQ
jgi:protein-tyrosine phosphatase